MTRIVGIFLALALLLAPACQNSEPISVGFVAELTGSHSDLGVASRNAVEMAVAACNAQGGIHGRPVQLLVRDNKNDPETTLRLIGELADQRVAAVIGPLVSSVAEACLQVARDKDVLLLSPSMSAEVLSGQDDNFLRVIATNRGQAETLAQEAARQGLTSAAVVFDAGNKQYAQTLGLIFKENAEKSGIAVPTFMALGKDEASGFDEASKRVAEAGPDATLLVMSGFDAAMMAQRLRLLGSRTRLFGSTWTNTLDLIHNGGRAVEGMYVVSEVKPQTKSEAFIRFKENYEREFKKPPTFISVLSYDAAQILFEGMRRASALTPQAVKKAILDQKTFPGLDHPIVLDRFGDAEARHELLQVRDNAFVPAP